MTTTRIKEKVMGFIHGRDGSGEWILPWLHMGATCVPCNELTRFIEDLLNKEQKEYETHNL